MDRKYLAALIAGQQIVGLPRAGDQAETISRSYVDRVQVHSDFMAATNREIAIVLTGKFPLPSIRRFWTSQEIAAYRESVADDPDAMFVREVNPAEAEWDKQAFDYRELFPSDDGLIANHEVSEIRPSSIIDALSYFKAPDNAWVQIALKPEFDFQCAPVPQVPVLTFSKDSSLQGQVRYPHILKRYLAAIATTAFQWQQAHSEEEMEFLLCVNDQQIIYTSTDGSYRAIVAPLGRFN